MKYVSLIHALNLPCYLETCGDWHTFSYQWDHPHVLESEGSLWGDYGIETDSYVPQHPELHNTANHIRSLLDMLYYGQFIIAQGMNDDYICNEKYDTEVFEKVYRMRNMDHWDQVDSFLEGKNDWVSKKTMEWKGYYRSIMEDFLQELNRTCGDCILKGDTAWMLCYHLDRFTEDVCLDSTNREMGEFIDAYCAKRNMEYRIGRDSIYDFYDIYFITNTHWDKLSDTVKDAIRTALEYEGEKKDGYIVAMQTDEFIHKDRLLADYSQACKRLGMFRGTSTDEE